MNKKGTHTFILLNCFKKKSIFIQEKIFDVIPLFASAEIKAFVKTIQIKCLLNLPYNT